ncbi:MAG: diguanylate cyclase [Kiritimatiellae bacterium]|nr:diguanylate cyclase [Kiritimatiellia bacterium]
MMAAHQLPLLDLAVAGFFTAAFQTLVVMAAAFVVLCLLFSHFRFQSMTRAVAESGDKAPPEDVLRFQIIQRLGTAHRMPAPFAVLLIGISDLDTIVGTHGAQAGREVVESVRDWVTGHVRAGDTVCVYGERQVAAIVDTARANAERVAARLAEGLAGSSCRCASGVVLRPSANIGLATFPENGDRVQILVDAADAALVTAAGTGTNTHHVAELTAPVQGAPGAESGEPPPDQRALIDPLTGVLRGDRLPSAMQKYVARFRKEGKPVSLLYLDVDSLRRYNDHYGQAAGDAILKALGEMLQAGVREDDLIGRYEGEEFLVVLPGAPTAALAAAQRLSLAVKRMSVPFAQTQLRFTVSIGVAGYPDHGGRPSQLFEAAAAALDAAKSKGRGRWMMYDSSLAGSVGKERTADRF